MWITPGVLTTGWCPGFGDEVMPDHGSGTRIDIFPYHELLVVNQNPVPELACSSLSITASPGNDFAQG
jgi:hypothetical protein